MERCYLKIQTPMRMKIMSDKKEKPVHQMTEQEKQWAQLPNEASSEQYKHVAQRAAHKAAEEIKRTKKRRQ